MMSSFIGDNASNQIIIKENCDLRSKEFKSSEFFSGLVNLWI